MKPWNLKFMLISFELIFRKFFYKIEIKEYHGSRQSALNHCKRCCKIESFLEIKNDNENWKAKHNYKSLRRLTYGVTGDVSGEAPCDE